MKKIALLLFALIIAFSLAIPATLQAGGSSKAINVKYPVILAHGYAGSEEFLFGIDYFYKIKKALNDEGVKNVYVVDMSAFDTSLVRGQQMKEFILKVLAVTGKSKVNIIGHSQGGVSARYMITNLGMAGRVASLVMISSPNRGTSLADVVCGKLPNILQWAVAAIGNTLWGGLVCGEKNPNFMAATYELTHYNMNNVFNPNTPDKAGIKYISYAGKMYGVTSNLILTPTWALIKYFDGDNDGIVPVNSSKWGIWKGVKTGLFGIDHFMEINHLFGITPGFDAEGFYVSIAEMLQGYGM